MLGFTLWVSSVLVSGICLALAKQFPCYAENAENVENVENEQEGENAAPYMLTGTKTGYLVVMNKDDAGVEHDGCEPPHSVWFLARHGTRYPSAVAMGHMRKHLLKIRDQVMV